MLASALVVSSFGLEHAANANEVATAIVTVENMRRFIQITVMKMKSPCKKLLGSWLWPIVSRRVG